jgi:hypothetical protein
MTSNQWYDVHRTAHLLGGLRAVNQAGPEVTIPINSRKHISFSIPQYHALSPILSSAGLSVIGIDYYEMNEQIQGYYPPTWKAFNSKEENDRASLLAEDTWHEIANAAFDKKNMELMDICSRISFETKACNQKLRKLSDAYNTELWALCNGQEFSPGRVETLNSFSIYLETHSLLRELCTLRDYLAEFVANFILKDALKAESRIRLMSSLRKEIKKSGITDHHIASELCHITNEEEGGWLSLLSAYRDLAVHYVPLGQAARREFVFKRFLPGSKLKEDIPSIYFPMPSNPYALKKLRSKGSPFQTVLEWVEASEQPDKDAPDTLEYCWHSVSNMMALSASLASQSPVEPKRLTFIKGVNAHNVVVTE